MYNFLPSLINQAKSRLPKKFNNQLKWPAKTLPSTGAFLLLFLVNCSSTSVRAMFQCLSKAATNPEVTPLTSDNPLVQTFTLSPSSIHLLSTESGPGLNSPILLNICLKSFLDLPGTGSWQADPLIPGLLCAEKVHGGGAGGEGLDQGIVGGQRCHLRVCDRFW